MDHLCTCCRACDTVRQGAGTPFILLRKQVFLQRGTLRRHCDLQDATEHTLSHSRVSL